MDTSTKLKERQMNMGMLGMRGRQTQWASLIEAAYVTKINQVAQNEATATPLSATRSAAGGHHREGTNRAALTEALFNAMGTSKGRTVTEKNRAKLAALMAPPMNQTTSEKNRAKLAAAMK
jgi:hypothetical protein